MRALFRLLWTVIALMAAAQPAGALELLSDISWAVSSDSGASREECPSESPCDDCPAGCPNCHCAPAFPTIVPPASVSVLAATELGTARPCQEQRSPPSLDPRPIYRPPRSPRSVA